jgi:DNA-binding winged helix-turn-helix (wHTH) protein/TolB-like protein/Tfp pilus assembly protein PilF
MSVAVPPVSPSAQKLRIGEWSVEPELNQIANPSGTVRLEPKAMAVLCYLAERPGQVVSREALLGAVWPGVVVSDDSLTQVIIKLRKALGDAADKPAYIQTISKRGYRLLARVEKSSETAAVPSSHREPPAERTQTRFGWIAGAGIAAIVAIAAGVWWFRSEPVPGVPPKALTNPPETAQASQPTIRIAPFTALGEDPQAKLLARGITADLVTDLSKVSGLSIIGVVGTLGGHAGPDTPGDATPAARYVVSGSVQRVADRVRLHIHLAESETGKQLWSDRFDRPLSGFFEIQEELVPKILQTLPAKVSEAELRRVAHRHTRSLEAYEYFQHGQLALLARQHAENETAREMFRRAIALDAAFARAYAGLALTYAADYRNQWTADGAAALDRAFEMARTAHEIDPDIRETYWVLAFVHLERRQHEQALQYLDTAIRLYPSFADAYALMAGIKTYMGRPAEAVPLLRTAMRLNPEAGYLYFLILGRTYFALGDLEQARLNLEHALLRNPVNLEARVYMAALHVTAGNKRAAAWEAEEIRALQPGFSSRRWLETFPLTDVSQKTRLVAALRELGL